MAWVVVIRKGWAPIFFWYDTVFTSCISGRDNIFGSINTCVCQHTLSLSLAPPLPLSPPPLFLIHIQDLGNFRRFRNFRICRIFGSFRNFRRCQSFLNGQSFRKARSQNWAKTAYDLNVIFFHTREQPGPKHARNDLYYLYTKGFNTQGKLIFPMLNPHWHFR